MRIVIVGLGSIARKHIKAIRNIDTGAELFALRREQAGSEEGITNVYSWDEISFKPDFILISNPTMAHAETIKKAIAFNCPLFIEKPVLGRLEEGDALGEAIGSSNIATYVACNLRFHPCLVYLKNLLRETSPRINEVNVYCGSNLANWRPGTSFRESYSANPELGGGVDLDLIHELDYSFWLFGKPLEVTRLRRNSSSLSIRSADFAAFHLLYPHYTVNVTLNYYRPTVKRSIEIVTDTDIITVDLVAAEVWRNEELIFAAKQFTMEQTYLEQMKYFTSHISNGKKMMNDFDEAFQVLKIAID